MKRFHLFLISGAVVAGLGTVVFETRLVSARRAQSQLLSRQIADTTRQRTALRRRRDGTARDLALAEQQLARLPLVALATLSSAAGARDLATEAWVARTQQLRALAAENPARLIPEMKLLTDEDWMRVAQHAAFETDAQRREALAALRDAAKVKFITRLSAAAQKWTLAEGLAKTPSSVAELVQYFESPVDPAILQRYEIVPESRPSSHASWRVSEIAAIDEDFDSRHSVEATGSHGWSGGGPLTWNVDYSSRVQSAYRAYAAANQGAQPPDISHVVPYIDPPLPRTVVEKLLKAERERKP